MRFLPIIANLRFQDVLDVLFLTFVAYHLYLWFQGTKAFKALVGLLILGVVYTLARSWGFFLTTWVLQILWQVLVILLIILFQSEIRQVLERVNPLQMIGLRKFAKPEEWIEAFTKAVYALAQRKIGALIIIERRDRVEEFVTEGEPLDAQPNPELLLSIFQRESPLHDGAMLIRGGRVTQVACYLPLSSAERLPKEWGTRHRAGLGLSERCDACVVVVSEERGEVSLASGGQINPVDNAQGLSQMILEATLPVMPDKATWMGKIHSFFVHRWPAKLGTLALVSFIWLLLAGQQDFEVSLSVPLSTKNLSEKMIILEPLNPTVHLTVRGLRKDASTLSEKNVMAEVDLSLARLGKRTFPITRDDVLLPSDRVQVVRIVPSQMVFKFKEEPQSEPRSPR